MAAQRKTNGNGSGNGLREILNRGLREVSEATAPDDDLNALDLLSAQHRNVEKLFGQIEQARGSRKQTLFEQLADELAVHATIEEKIFYPNVKRGSTEELLQESVEEHLEVKRALADMMAMDPEDDEFDAKLSVLQEQVTHHAKEEEEGKLFPIVRKELDSDLLAALAGEMIRLMVELDEEGAPPRTHIPEETAAAAPI
jgi:hemerythrin superfamily protein